MNESNKLDEKFINNKSEKSRTTNLDWLKIYVKFLMFF